MKFLVFGIGGMAGHMIAQYLKEKGHSVIGFARTPSKICPTIVGNARNETEVCTAIHSERFDSVVNCIGILNAAVDRDLPNGIFINSYLPHFMAHCCDEAGIHFVHISSDCVFSGKRGRYLETDVPDETSYYGRTKALGEVPGRNHFVLRTSIVGPELKDGVGLFHWFMKQSGTVNGFTHTLWSGVTTLELAKAVMKAAQCQLDGLCQLSNNHAISKYDLLCLFNRYFRENKIQIIRQETPVSDKSICCSNKVFKDSVPSYEEMVREMAGWMAAHKDLYSRYEVTI